MLSFIAGLIVGGILTFAALAFFFLLIYSEGMKH